MKVGEPLEMSWWITGDESPELLAHHKRTLIEAMDELSEGWVRTPVEFHVKHPMDDRVPPVPDHIQGIAVGLLVAEATLIAKKVFSHQGSFIANLERKDLMRLRHLTRKGRNLSDEECDEIIEEIGPEAALDTLKRGVDGRLIH